MNVRAGSVLLLIAVSLVLALATWPALLGLQTVMGVAQAVSLRALILLAVLALLVVTIVVTVATRRGRLFFTGLTVLLAMFVVVNGSILVSRGLGAGSDALPAASTPANERDLTVLTWNTLGNATGAETIARVAIDERADIISLPETTDAVATEVAIIMRNAGAPMWAHHVAFDNTADARSTSILISPRLGSYRVIDDRGNTSVLPTVIAEPVSGEGPTIVAVHAVAPIVDEMSHWRSDLAWLAKACSRSNTIMAGDFNATVDHMVGLGSQGATLGQCHDAAVSTGSGAIGTWNTAWPAFLGSPIDHVMATPDWRFVGTTILQTRDDAGSDHRPVVARLTRVDGEGK